MNIDPQKTASLFYFAHQDDECGVFQLIEDELSSGAQVHCFYYTSGTFSGLPSVERNQESINVLLKLGVLKENIHFIGSKYNISDGKLVEHLEFIYKNASSCFNKFHTFSKLLIPAWEGGHPDHDALHAAVLLAAQRHNLLEKTFQFALYNNYQCSGPMFRVLSPLPDNGKVFKSKISLVNRLRFLRYCLSYKSQRQSWIGLFPFFLLHYLLDGYQSWQSVSIQRIQERQHDGRLYFEYRQFYSKDEFRKNINIFLSST